MQPESDKVNVSHYTKLLTLLTLHSDIRHKTSARELEFLLVNKTTHLIPYRQCLFFRINNAKKIKFLAASGLVDIEHDSPYLIWLNKLISKKIQNSEETVFVLSAEDCEPAEKEVWAKWTSANAMLLLMKDQTHDKTYGLWLDRDKPFNQVDITLIEDLADGFVHAYAKLKNEAIRPILGSFSRQNKFIPLAFIACLLLTLWPTRLTITAPAEVIARDPFVISIPFDGVLDKILVEPNQVVQKGDILAIMDEEELQNKVDILEQDLSMVRSAFEKTQREALSDNSKKVELNTLKTELRIKQIEKNFAEKQLAESKIIAPQTGVVIFADKNDLRGKPVRTGERIMQISDIENSELLVRIPIDSMIQLNETVPAKYFLNVSPLSAQTATIKTVGYQASPDPDGLLTYKARLKINPDQKMPKIGWTGTAKLYGDRTTLLYSFLRRPLISLRRILQI